MLVATSVASAKKPSSVRSQLEGLAQSSAGKKAERALTAALPAVAMSRAAESLLARYGSEITPFESSLLKVDVSIGARKNQVALSALSSGRKLTKAQVTTLRRLFASLADNPALKLLIQKGRALERSPKTLGSYLAAAANASSTPPAKLPSTGNAAVDSVDARIHSALTSAAVVAVNARVRKLLSGPRAEQYVTTLPPVLAAAMIPSQTLATYSLASRRSRVAISAIPTLPAGVNALLVGVSSLTEEAANELLAHAAVELGGSLARAGSLGLNVESLDNLVGYVLTNLGVEGVGFGVSGLAAFAGPFEALIAGWEVGDKATDFGLGLWYSSHPLGLKIAPSVNVKMTAGTPMTFDVEGIGSNGTVEGTEPGAMVQMVPNGGPCPAHACRTTMAGPDAVTATMVGGSASPFTLAPTGNVTTSIPVTVLPGSLKFFSLSPSTVTIPLGADTNFAVSGTDAWDNNIDPDAVVSATTFSISPGSPKGWCVANTCGAHTPGTYTVTATSGAFSQSATLIVGAGTYPISFTASVNVPMGGQSQIPNSGAEVTVTGVQQGDCNSPSYTQSVCNYVFTGATGTLYGNEPSETAPSGFGPPCSVSAQVAVHGGEFVGGVTLGEPPDGNGGIALVLLALATFTAQGNECDAGIAVGSPGDTPGNLSGVTNLSSPWVPGSHTSSWTVSVNGNTSSPVVGTITMNWQY